MRIEFDLTGTDRKALVRAISEITGAKAIYKFMPTCAYEIDYFTVTRDGALEFDDRADSEEIESLLDELEQKGFHAKPSGGQVEESEGSKETLYHAESGEQGAPVGLTVSIPLDKLNLGRVTNLLEAKGALIQRALGITALPIEITEDAVLFPWFAEMPEPEVADACTRLIAAMCKMSKEQTRISAKAVTPENQKYAFRCFLLRLGFIGNEYKAARKVLLRSLSGNSAWKDGGRNEE